MYRVPEQNNTVIRKKERTIVNKSRWLVYLNEYSCLLLTWRVCVYIRILQIINIITKGEVCSQRVGNDLLFIYMKLKVEKVETRFHFKCSRPSAGTWSEIMSIHGCWEIRTFGSGSNNRIGQTVTIQLRLDSYFFGPH